jgi:hypothetical protein
MKTYRLSAAGRRTTLVLLLGALAIWGFALWSFRSTLNLHANPLYFWYSLSATIDAGLTVGQVVPALLMLVLIVATPLLFWNLLEEWAAGYTPTDEGLRFTSLGIDLTYPWASISDVRPVDEDSDEPMHEVQLSDDHTDQIRNPLLRFLHRQAYGRRKLLIYAGVAERDELLAAIAQRSGGAGATPSPATMSVGDQEAGAAQKAQ